MDPINNKKHDKILEKYFLRLFEYQRTQPFRSTEYIINSIKIYELLSKYIYIQGQKRIIYIDKLLRALKEYKDFYLELTKSLLSAQGITLNSSLEEPYRLPKKSRILLNNRRENLGHLYLKKRTEKLKNFDRVENELGRIKSYETENFGINFAGRTVWYIYLLDIFIDETFFGVDTESKKAIEVLTKYLPTENDSSKSIKIPIIDIVTLDSSNVDWSRTPNVYPNPYYNFKNEKFNVNRLIKNRETNTQNVKI